ncbi:MAG: hypothetical protein HY725_23215 [Candidatus Rokubacteria bacterium]|nr:hypothetical protein [Candidatus Rokubacteria bacterium]
MPAKKDMVRVTCPHCQAKLTVDPALEAVIAHDPPPPKRAAEDLGAAFKALQGASTRREEAFRESLKSEQTKGKVLDRKFQEGLKKAKDAPDPGPRPIDLD